MQALDTFLRQATERGTVPGAVVCVASRGQVVWQQAYGAAAFIPQYRPMRCDTLFDIASLTKVVATTSLLLLAHHEDVCHLDAALQHFYPQTHRTPTGSTTVRQLLAHTGGLAAWSPLYQALLPGDPACPPDASPAARRRQALQKILQEPLAYPPGVQTLYSDLGFILLADILETQYQQPLDRLFSARVAQPLGLHCTGYRPLGSPSPLPASPTAYAATEVCPWRDRLLAGEVHDENAWAMGGVAGHAGLFATAHYTACITSNHALSNADAIFLTAIPATLRVMQGIDKYGVRSSLNDILLRPHFPKDFRGVPSRISPEYSLRS